MKDLIPEGLNCEQSGKVCPYLKEVKRVRLDKSTCKFSKTCKKKCEDEECEEIITRCDYLRLEEILSEGQWALFAKMKICGENIPKEKSN